MATIIINAEKIENDFKELDTDEGTNLLRLYAKQTLFRVRTDNPTRTLTTDDIKVSDYDKFDALIEKEFIQLR